MATVNVVNIIPRKFLETVATPQYTSSNCKTLIDKFTATNVGGTFNTVVTVNLVASGGTAGLGNQVVSKAIAPGAVYQFPELVGQILDVGGFISAFRDSGGEDIVISATGREIT